MSIPQRIKDLANKVRNEIYGKDVRESIAESMEVTGETAEEAKVRSVEQTDRVDTLITENPQPSEVVDARLGYNTLRDKLNSTDQQLAQVDDKFEFISIKDFPRLALENEDSARINRALSSISKGTVQLYDEVYTTTQPIKMNGEQNLKGVGHASTIIRNTNGTNILETVDTEERFYNIGVYDLELDGVEKLNQYGLFMPHVSHSFFQNVLVRNVDVGFKLLARKQDGTVTGAYYNAFINPIANRTNIGIDFSDVANENNIYGGKVNLSNIGIKLGVNNTSVFGTAFEGNHQYHVYLTGYNNSFYGSRMEGYDTATGIYSETLDRYCNFFYSTHFQGLEKLVEEVSGNVVRIDDGGIKLSPRVDNISFHSKKNSGGDSPMIYMEELVSGGRPIYKSKKRIGRGAHFEGIDQNEDKVFVINSYGEYINHIPNRGIRLTSPNGTVYGIRVNDSGEIIVVDF